MLHIPSPPQELLFFLKLPRSKLENTKSAVTGALEGYEYVITTTTKPIKENEQVRLASE